MTTTTWVAVAAFCISLSTLIANVALTWLKWPRIVVEVAARHDGASSASWLPDLGHTVSTIYTPGAARAPNGSPVPTVSRSW
jgi:hypothetical protein